MLPIGLLWLLTMLVGLWLLPVGLWLLTMLVGLAVGLPEGLLRLLPVGLLPIRLLRLTMLGGLSVGLLPKGLLLGRWLLVGHLLLRRQVDLCL